MTADAEKSLRFGAASAVGGGSPSHAPPLLPDSLTGRGAPRRSLTTRTVQNSSKCDALPGGGPVAQRGHRHGCRDTPTRRGPRGSAAGREARHVRSSRPGANSYAHVSEHSRILCHLASLHDEVGRAASHLRVPGQYPGLRAGPPRGSAGWVHSQPHGGKREQQSAAVLEQTLVTAWCLRGKGL